MVSSVGGAAMAGMAANNASAEGRLRFALQMHHEGDVPMLTLL
jgi:hypothetical protein